MLTHLSQIEMIRETHWIQWNKKCKSKQGISYKAFGFTEEKR
jgi:hypothetical protein